MWPSRRCSCWNSAPLASHDERAVGSAGPRRKPRCRGTTDRDADAVRSSATPPPEHWTARNRAASTSASHFPSCRLGGGSDFLPSASTRSHMETSDGRGSYPSLWGRCRGGLRPLFLDRRRCFASAMPKFLFWASRVGGSRNGSRACGTPTPASGRPSPQGRRIQLRLVSTHEARKKRAFVSSICDCPAAASGGNNRCFNHSSPRRGRVKAQRSDQSSRTILSQDAARVSVAICDSTSKAPHFPFVRITPATEIPRRRGPRKC